LKGSVPGPKKRGLVITPAIRPTKFTNKKKLEIVEIR
jgi:ribosomal protein L3